MLCQRSKEPSTDMAHDIIYILGRQTVAIICHVIKDRQIARLVEKNNVSFVKTPGKAKRWQDVAMIES